MQGVVDRQMNQVQVQGTRTQTLINNKAPKWQIIDESETLRQTIQEGTKVEASVTPACEAMEIAAIEGGDEAITKEFESISKYQYKFEDL